MQTWVVLPFADGTYTFSLGLGQIAEIERACDAGIGEVYARLMAGRYGFGESEILPLDARYRFSDLVEVIRQGLIGGRQGEVNGAVYEVTPPRANQLVDNYCIVQGDSRQTLKRLWALAAAILASLIEGYDGQKKSPEPQESAPTDSTSPTP